MARSRGRDAWRLWFVSIGAVALAVQGCGPLAPASTPVPTPRDRLAAIPSGAVKVTPQSDRNPVSSFSAEFAQPVPVPGLVDSAGAEDSPFLLPDGKTLYFFFTPDVSVPVEKQIADGVTGIYVARQTAGRWTAGERVALADAGTLALDGCEYVNGDTIWFCSTREGYNGINWFTASQADGSWHNWQIQTFDPGFQVGEMHLSRDMKTIYFGSSRPGGKGGMDIWQATRAADGSWSQPVDVGAVATAGDEGWPALSVDETELWFNRDYALWRSQLVNGEWQAPVKMFGPLAGEATLDAEGNVYFVHHYYDGASKMIEADIYVAYRKPVS